MSRTIEDPEQKFAIGACIVLQEPRRAISVGYNGRPDSYKGKRDDYGIYTYVDSHITVYSVQH